MDEHTRGGGSLAGGGVSIHRRMELPLVAVSVETSPTRAVPRSGRSRIGAVKTHS